MRAIARVLRGLVVCLLGLVVVINTALLISRFTLGQDPPHILGFYPMVVATGSMEPNVPAGAMVVAHTQETYAVGDVISFRQGGAVVTHRVVEKTAEGYRTAGDANNTTDTEMTPAEAVLGRVVLCLPGAGAVLLALREPAGILIVAAVGAALLLLPGKRGKERHEDAEKKT